MAVAGNSYIVTLRQTHLGWGEVRYTNTRKIIRKEAYIPIPAGVAKSFNIYNANFNPNGCEILGVNIFKCTSEDGFFKGVLKATGCVSKGDVYAKNLHGRGDLKALAPWYDSWNAQAGDQVEVRWVSPTDIVIKHY